MQKVIFDFSPNEPNLTPEELQQLDAVADPVEVRRLQNMSVLINIEDMNADDIDQVKTLSRRFVRTRRAKVINSKQVWLRRSRLVAREFSCRREIRSLLPGF